MDRQKENERKAQKDKNVRKRHRDSGRPKQADYKLPIEDVKWTFDDQRKKTRPKSSDND